MMKLMKKALVVLLLTVSCFWSVQAFDVPQSKENFYVADYSGVISDEDAEEIREINAHLESVNGSQIVVAVFDFLNGEEIADVALECFNEWQIGKKEEGNGVLLLLAVGEDDYYCLQGKGLEKLLPASTLDDLLYENLEPDFAAGNYSEGVIRTVRQLADRLEKIKGDPYENQQEIVDPQGQGNDPLTEAENAYEERMVTQIVLILFFMICVLVILHMMGGRRSRFYGPRYYGRPYHRPYYHRYDSRPSSSYRPSSSSRPSRPSSSSRPSRPSARNYGGGGSSRGGGAGRRK